MMLVYKLGTICDIRCDELILKFSNELDTDDAEFFSECLYRNSNNILYLYITWGRCSHSPAKEWLIKEYGLVGDGDIIPMSMEDCNILLRYHRRTEDIEEYLSRCVLDSAVNTLLRLIEFK